MEYLRIQEVSAFIGQMDQSSKLPQNTLEVRSALSCLLFSTLVLEVLANLIKGEEINDCPFIHLFKDRFINANYRKYKPLQILAFFIVNMLNSPEQF